MPQFFISARTIDQSDVMAGYVEVEDFDQALNLAHEKAAAQFSSNPYRLTSVTEQPELANTSPLRMDVFLKRPDER